MEEKVPGNDDISGLVTSYVITQTNLDKMELQQAPKVVNKKKSELNRELNLLQHGFDGDHTSVKAQEKELTARQFKTRAGEEAGQRHLPA